MAWNHINDKLLTPERRLQLRLQSTTHGMKYHLLYSVYQNMVGRCHVPGSHNYERYGARGISVCSAWRDDPSIFFKWATTSGYTKGLKLDRRDNDGNYSPDNCRWVTAKISARNRRSTKLDLPGAAVVKALALRGVPQKLIGALYGIKFGAVSDIKRGVNWPDADTLFVVESK